MKYSTNRSLTSRDFPENLQNRGKSEKLSDRKITSPIEVAISRIKANFGINCQNDANFVARVLKSTVQKSDFSGGVE